MTDETERRIRLAQRAQAILADEVVVEAKQFVRDELMDAWAKTKPSDVEARERIYMMRRMFDRVWERIDVVISDGKVLDATLPQHERRGLLKA